jgi:hypothetical protein
MEMKHQTDAFIFPGGGDFTFVLLAYNLSSHA